MTVAALAKGVAKPSGHHLVMVATGDSAPPAVLNVSRWIDAIHSQPCGATQCLDGDRIAPRQYYEHIPGNLSVTVRHDTC